MPVIPEEDSDSDDNDDEEYKPSSSLELESGSSGSFFHPNSQDKSREPKVIVYMNLLLQLFSVCRVESCGAAVDPANIETYERGACLVVSGVCNQNHTFKWSSSPMRGTGHSARPEINILLTVYTLVCGMHVDQVIDYFKHLQLSVPGSRYFYQMFSSLVYKCIWAYWLQMQASLLQKVKSSGRPLHIAGDGKYDSPGFSARYCTYYIMDLADRSILALWVAIKHQVSSSSAMEPYACKTLLLFLVENCKLSISSLTTDRSSNIKQMMVTDERLKGVKHCYDVWHFIKSILKDLWDLSKRKYAEKLSLWIASVTNMLWWSFSTSNDEETLREKILSIPRHLCNRHQFPSNKKHMECLHGDLSENERRKSWLKENSKEVEKLVLALRGHNDSRLNDLANMTEFHHTGFIENVNSLNNKYCSKTYVYGYESMLVRAAITAIDHNMNLNRPQAVTKDGEARYRVETNRAGSKYIIRDIKVPKDNSWRDKITDYIMECVDTDTVPVVDIPVGKDIPRNQAKIPKPSKSEAVKYHQSRMRLRASQM